MPFRRSTSRRKSVHKRGKTLSLRKTSSRKTRGGKRTLPPALQEWIKQVKHIQKQHGISYKDALKMAAKMRKK